MAGGFTDISNYIRESSESDVYLFWREFPDGKKTPGQQRSPASEELCPVPIGDATAFAEKHSLWEWNDDQGKWDRRRKNELVPGMTLLCSIKDGGYSETLGWTGQEEHAPSAIPDASRQTTLDSDRRDQASVTGWRDLDRHLEDVHEEAKSLGNSLQLPRAQANALALAARWHDAGKSLKTWQDAVELYLGDRYKEGLWAKFPSKEGATFRPGIRHEEASAQFAASLWEQGEPGWSELAVYLIACHHGKVRLALGAHGAKPISDLPDGRLRLNGGDEPGVDLDMKWFGFAPPSTYNQENQTVSVDGLSWPGLVGRLIGGFDMQSASDLAIGPFRLAYLEALIRCADWRGSERCDEGDTGGSAT